MLDTMILVQPDTHPAAGCVLTLDNQQVRVQATHPLPLPPAPEGQCTGSPTDVICHLPHSEAAWTYQRAVATQYLDAGYAFEQPAGVTLPPGLSPAVMQELARLQVPINRLFNPYDITWATHEEDTSAGPRVLPFSLCQLAFGYLWEGVFLSGEPAGTYIHELDMQVTGAELPRSKKSARRAYFQLGQYDGGNYALLVNLLDNDLTNPALYYLDHDWQSEENEADPVGSLDCRLAGFLAGLNRMEQ
jgi:hypothetical protein